MKKVAGTLKLAYAQYRELKAFSQFGSDLDEDTRRRLAQGERIVEVLKQGAASPIPVELQVVILYAATHNLLDNIDTTDIQKFESGLFEYITEKYSDITDEILKTGDFSEEKLRTAIIEFTKIFTGGV